MHNLWLLLTNSLTESSTAKAGSLYNFLCYLQQLNEFVIPPLAPRDDHEERDDRNMILKNSIESDHGIF